SFPHRVLEYYKDGLVNFVDSEKISKAKLKVVLDYSFGSASNFFPSILSEYNLDIIALNSYEDPKRFIRDKTSFDAEYKRLGDIVKSLSADIGVMMDSGAEKIFLVDGDGNKIGRGDSQAVMVHTICKNKPGCKVAVPINSSKRIEKIARENGCEVIYTKMYNRNMMQAAEIKGVKLVADGEGGFIFPEFMPWFDAMASISIILNLVADKKLCFNNIRKNFPEDLRVHKRIPCDWSEKGTVMRNIMEHSKDLDIELVDGVKINMGKDAWVLLIPDSDKPYFNVYAEGKDKVESKKIAEDYKLKVNEWKK
ncbi:MAG: hypothetical protein M0R46_09090, partial [Candidatus Muirbacterium halophilum]|nr:hypothetical protein [Candidatus Muirbacterium halophilum]